MKLHPKTPLPLVIGMLVNIVLVVLFEVLLLYRTPLPPTPELLVKADSRYENCQIISDTNISGNRGVRFYMVKTDGGETDLVPLRQHTFFSSRARLYRGKILKNLNLNEDSSTRQIYGMELYTISVANGQISAVVSGGSFQQTALTKYMLIGLALAFLELLLWEKLRGNT